MYRETHSSKRGTRIFVRRIKALLIGNAVLLCGYKDLSGALNTDYREEAKRAIKPLTVIIVRAYVAVKSRQYSFRDVGDTAAARSSFFCYANGKSNGVDHLAHSRRGISLAVSAEYVGAAKAVVIGITAEYAYVAFASVKYYALLANGDSLKLLRSSGSNAPFTAKPCVESDVDLIKTAIELDRFNRDTGTDDFSVLNSDCRSIVYDITTEIGQIYTGIFKAILVAAAVKYTVAVDGNASAAIARAARICSVFGHRISFLLFFIRHMSSVTLYAVNKKM